MVVDQCGIHRAHTLATTLDYGTLRCHGLPAHGGHHLNPIEGFWRVMHEASGTGWEQSAAAGQVYPPSAHNTSRTTNICVQLVAYSASHFAGVA
jgi:hypothetical protein